MQIRIEVSEERTTPTGLAEVRLDCPEIGVQSVLDMKLSSVREFALGDQSAAIDTLFVASIVYSIDKLVPRWLAADRWTRSLSVVFPVYNPELWAGVQSQLEACLAFLTGDRWTCGFTQLRSSLYRPVQHREGQIPPYIEHPDAVSLFSGGLDSLVGIIDWLESHRDGTLWLVSHHDGKVPGPNADQLRLLPLIRHQYQGRVGFFGVRVGPRTAGTEITFRSRSFLFIAAGVYVAYHSGNRLALLIPENGTIALNHPLSPSRRGSCSTRTAHPLYLSMLGDMLNGLGIQIPIVNPLELKTKGEVVAQCLNQELLGRIAAQSASCAKHGRKQFWDDRYARACGFCMPCIYRRAALHTIGLDTERYGIDICIRGVERFRKGFQKDFRAFAGFLQRINDDQQIAEELVANGSLDLERLPEYVGLIDRARDELRAWLRDKGSDDVKRLAGL